MDSLLQAFIFLSAGVVAVPIASRLGLGSVLGYLIAGVLIGPFALNLLHDATQLMHFAEFGVVMMLFLIGLELQPSLLWRMRFPILGMGGLQMALTTAAITGIAMYFNQPWQTALAIGLILSLSSTALALQILAEKKLMNASSGKSSFAVLLFQDIAVIPIIAILPLLAITAPLTNVDTANIAAVVTADAHSSGGGNLIAHLPGWQQTIIVVMAVVSIILAGRFLTRPLFRFIADSKLRELFTATALMLVIGIALLMTTVGLSPALGAFTAGVVMADSEYRHELEANIDPFKALLLGLFFISVGASIDFALLGSKPIVIMEIVLGLVALKFIILLFLAKLFKIPGGGSYWFSFSLAQGGEFGFVLLASTLENRILHKETIDILTAAIALSMVLTPLLILFNEKFVIPRFKEDKSTTTADEEPMEEQDNPVIIAGFGRYGQIVGRLLIGNDIPVTVLDHSATHIERVRRFGFKVYYGDAGREDLLHTAGADKAKVLVIAVDDREKAKSILKMAKHSYPHLLVHIRAYDAMHYHELKSEGADFISRELFLSSLSMGEKTLQALGMRAYKAKRQARQFAVHDQKTTDRLGEHISDNKRYISESRHAQEEVLNILRGDRMSYRTSEDHSWDATGHE
ncbi:monovalent cation:proton antiporter-2 (CPA2) family protein [Leucothrix pacifica]|uniref:Potassium transporter n=1 Tax=Leucothrix pacifica TaxID=1247513 RepID=A0A317CLL5_9GAMM|nr:monovalent cation:proton antiporter-2 (CPA2) family protein [Leucothrix pacifica]PWQ99418.1 potassium transporter [Leucothrix pacifica]